MSIKGVPCLHILIRMVMPTDLPYIWGKGSTHEKALVQVPWDPLFPGKYLRMDGPFSRPGACRLQFHCHRQALTFCQRHAAEFFLYAGDYFWSLYRAWEAFGGKAGKVSKHQYSM